MKAYLSINQKQFVAIAKAKGIKVDLIDPSLFDWIVTFVNSNKALKKLIDNKLYIWVSYTAIREDNPLININSNEVIGRRLNKLVDLGILEKHLSKKEGNKTFFHITQFAYDYLLENRELPTQESEGTDSKVGSLPTPESDNSKLNSKLDSNKKNKTKKEEDEDLARETFIELGASGFLNDKSLFPINHEAYLDWMEFRREIKKPITKTSAKQQMKMLCKYQNEIQEQIINTSIQNGYQGLFEPKQQINSTNGNAPSVATTMENINALFDEANQDTPVDVEVIQ